MVTITGVSSCDIELFSGLKPSQVPGMMELLSFTREAW